MNRKPYTQEKSRIVLSFCNADGGHIFVHWLRRELMKELNYFSSRSIYLDNIETRNFAGGEAVYHNGTIGDLKTEGSLKWAMEVGRNQGLPVIGPDKRPTAIFAGYIPNGAMFLDKEGVDVGKATWLKNWREAVMEAKVIIQIQSRQYFKSEPCAKEIAEISRLVKSRAGNLKLIAITLDGTVPQVASANSGVLCKPLPLAAEYSKSLAGTYELSPNDLRALTHELIHWGRC